MRRRQFIASAAVTAMAWPVALRAQQAPPTRKIGVLLNFLLEDVDGQARIRAFSTAMRGLGWNEGDNLQTEIRFAGDEGDRYGRYAKELVEAAPDLIVASASPSVARLTSR